MPKHSSAPSDFICWSPSGIAEFTAKGGQMPEPPPFPLAKANGWIDLKTGTLRPNGLEAN